MTTKTSLPPGTLIKSTYAHRNCYSWNLTKNKYDLGKDGSTLSIHEGEIGMIVQKVDRDLGHDDYAVLFSRLKAIILFSGNNFTVVQSEDQGK